MAMVMWSKAIRFGGLLVGALVLIPVFPVMSQQDKDLAGVGPVHIAQADESFDFDIPSQALPRSLSVFSAVTGLQVLYTETAAFEHTASGLRGRFTAEQALDRLVDGSGLDYRFVDDRTVTLARKTAGQNDDGVLPQEVRLDPITVFGEKTEKDLQNTITSVQVFTQEDIESSSIEDIDDVFDQAANVTQRFGGEGFAIRGINNASVAGGGVSPLATLYIDGSPISSFAVRTGIEELWDVKQVEILRGPQSTSQGRNTLAGAILIDTNDPVYQTEAAARIGYGTQDSRKISGMVNTNVIDDMLAVRITADYQSADGFNDNPTLGIDDQAFSRNKNFRGKILFEPTSGFSNLLTFTYADNESGDDEVDGTDPFSRRYFGNIQGFENTRQTLVALDSTFDINEYVYLKNIVTFNSADYDRLDDNSPNVFDDPNTFSRNNITDTFTEEFRLHFDFESTRAHIGFYYANIDFDDASGGVTRFSDAQLVDLGILAPLLPFYSGLTISQDRTFDRREKNYAGFGEITHDFSDFVTVTAGIRYDVVDFDNISTDNRTLLTALPGPCGIIIPPGVDACAATDASLLALLDQPDDPGSDASSNAFLPNVGIILNWTQDLSTSFSVRRGYRSGGSGTSVLTFTPFTFEPEFVWNYEAAIRSSWFDNRLTVNGNVFYMDWSDQQVNIPGPGGQLDALTVNAGESRLFGFELETFAKPMPALLLRSSLGYVDTEFTDFVSDQEDLSGNEFPNAPRWTFSAGGRYEFANGFYFQTDVNYRSGAYVGPDNVRGNEEDARTLVNAKLGYQYNDAFDVAVYTTNLFDEEYLTNSFTSGDLVSSKVGDGRFVGAELRWRY